MELLLKNRNPDLVTIAIFIKDRIVCFQIPIDVFMDKEFDKNKYINEIINSVMSTE